MRLYRALLHLFPASFRIEYGEEMCRIFARRREAASGPLRVTALWLTTSFEMIPEALQVHWDILRQDLRYTARTLGRSPGFAATVVVVAALGIGASTAVVSITDHVLVRALPFPRPEELVKVWQKRLEYTRFELSPVAFRDWQRLSTSFSAMGAYTPMAANMVSSAEPARVDGTRVTAEIFHVLGVQPLAGRLFTADDERESASATLIISHRLWQTALGGDRGALGQKVLLDGEPFVVIGIMPRGFIFPNRDAQFWQPFRFGPRDYQDRNNNYLAALARLKPGVSLPAARTEMLLIAAQLDRQFPNGDEGNSANVVLLRDEVSAQTRMLLNVLSAAALCLLLIACSNLANLLLARALARRKEWAVRAALGAGRERLLRQMLTESLMLALLGGALGVLLAVWAAPLLVRLVPHTLPIAELPPLDVRLLLFAGSVTLVTGLGFGVLPALRACGGTVATNLHHGDRGGLGGRKQRLRSVLVVAEVAACMLLLVSSGLLIRALWRIQETDPGFRREGVLTLRTALPWPKYARTAPRFQFYNRVLEGAQSLPGVTGAAYISYLPMTMRGGIWGVKVAGRAPRPNESENASVRFVTPGFFAALGIPRKQGRDVAESDTMQSLQIAVVSESFVRRYFPDKDPLGQVFEFSFLRMRTIAGVVGDVRVRGMERDSEPQVYIPYRQVQDGWFTFYAPKDLVVRTAGDPMRHAPALRQIIRSADPEQPVSDVRLLADIVDADTAPRAVQVRVLGAFAALAFLLAGIGIHGLLSFTVSQRTQEIGVRVALGAQPRDILGLVLRESLVLGALGVTLGAALAYAAARALVSLLAGITPSDPLTFSAAIALALAMTLAGSLLPAIRALRVDPSTAMRIE